MQYGQILTLYSLVSDAKIKESRSNRKALNEIKR